jgi:hypothetical protein
MESDNPWKYPGENPINSNIPIFHSNDIFLSLLYF